MSVVADALKRFFAKPGEPVLFAGAGVSSRAGLPVWDSLLQHLMESILARDTLTAAQMGEQLRERNLTKAAEYYFLGRIPEGDKYDLLVGQLKSFDATKLKDLASLPFRSLFTTNFDRALLNAFTPGSVPLDYRYGDASFSEALWQKDRFVARIHGSVESPRTIVLTDSAFGRLLTDEQYSDLLVNCFTRLNVLFLGFSFADPAIRHVLEQIRRDYGFAPPGRHMALVPQGSESAFISSLDKHNVEVIYYNGDDHHRALWDGIKQFVTAPAPPAAPAKGAPPTMTPTQPRPVAPPFETARRYLAACYARMRMGSRITPLREMVIEGMVAGLLQSAAPKGLRSVDIVRSLHAELGITSESASDLTEKAIEGLRREGLCRQVGDGFVWSSTNNAEAGLQDSIDFLVKSARDRAVVQEGWNTTSEVGQALNRFFKELVLKRGWDLGAAYANHRPPEAVDIATPLRGASSALSQSDITRLQRVCESILTRPSESEAEILAQLGRISFALELVVQSPRTALFHASVLPERIYFDANVLMPAITQGHPYHAIYSASIHKLREAAARANIDLQLLAYEGFLNEVVSHRRIALQIMEQTGDHFLRDIRRAAIYHGTANINVFISAYAGMGAASTNLKFTEFLQRYAPYADESELAKWIAGRGIRVVKDAEMRGSEFPAISLYLQRAYSSGIVAGKEMRLIEHDAVQLSGLAKDYASRRRSILVTADKTLRDLLDKGSFGYLTKLMVSHVGLAQMIDLLVGVPEGERNLTGMLWVAKSSSKTDAFRSYLTALALMEYDEALAMEIPRVVDRIAEEMSEGLAKAGVDPDSTNPTKRIEAFKLMERYEAKFFEGMREVIERRRRQGDA